MSAGHVGLGQFRELAEVLEAAGEGHDSFLEFAEIEMDLILAVLGDGMEDKDGELTGFDKLRRAEVGRGVSRGEFESGVGVSLDEPGERFPDSRAVSHGGTVAASHHPAIGVGQVVLAIFIEPIGINPKRSSICRCMEDCLEKRLPVGHGSILFRAN